MTEVERWGRFELVLNANVSGIDNPFTQVSLKATVIGADGTRSFDGFYGGDGKFVVRYMPMNEGAHRITTRSNLLELDGVEAEFLAVPAGEGNRGPVNIDGMHFSYADGARCFIMGTTAYVWHQRPAEIRNQTLATYSQLGSTKSACCSSRSTTRVALAR